MHSNITSTSIMQYEKKTMKRNTILDIFSLFLCCCCSDSTFNRCVRRDFFFEQMRTIIFRVNYHFISVDIISLKPPENLSLFFEKQIDEDLLKCFSSGCRFHLFFFISLLCSRLFIWIKAAVSFIISFYAILIFHATMKCGLTTSLTFW